LIGAVVAPMEGKMGSDLHANDYRQTGAALVPMGAFVPARMTSRFSELAASATFGLAAGLIIAALAWSAASERGYAAGAADTSSACITALSRE
jgi:hypothetical protein